MRCRPDDYSSTTNSVNPSPKKQPRLNIPSPSDSKWMTNSRSQTATDESIRKRYKSEDQRYSLEDNQSLSDIQFIDCNTPEHSMGHPTMIYASVQVHNPPSSQRSSILESSLEGSSFDLKAEKDDRFSYPGMGTKFTAGDEKKYVCRVPVNEGSADSVKVTEHPHPAGHISRYSYCDPHTSSNGTHANGINLVLRSCSAEMVKNDEMERSKLSLATPSSPAKSPRYSLLVGETSSENSSSLNTPVFDMDISITGLMPTDQRTGDLKSEQFDTKDSSNFLISEDSTSNVSIRRASICSEISSN